MAHPIAVRHLPMTLVPCCCCLCFTPADRKRLRRIGRIVRRAKDGRQAARKAGTKFGRKPKLNITQQMRARDLLRKGAGVRSVADEMNVHYSTISRLR